MATLNGSKYATKNVSGRQALNDYANDRTYWIGLGGNPKLSINDMKYTVLRGLYPTASKALHDLELVHYRTVSGT